jgi:hypothetical protein
MASAIPLWQDVCMLIESNPQNPKLQAKLLGKRVKRNSLIVDPFAGTGSIIWSSE